MRNPGRFTSPVRLTWLVDCVPEAFHVEIVSVPRWIGGVGQTLPKVSESLTQVSALRWIRLGGKRRGIGWRPERLEQ